MSRKPHRSAPKRRLQVVERATNTLVPYANNARHHPRAQIRKIADSIRHFGFTNPLLIDEAGMILCGHGRYEAALQLGMPMVPTILLSELSEEDRRAYILADNVIAEKAGWSKKMLATELQGLVEIGYDLSFTGFDMIEIDTALSFDTDEPVDDDVVELPGESPAITRLGDLWTIGPNRLVCGDARELATLEALMGDERAELAVLDPPYNVKISGNVSGLGKHKHGEFVMGSGEMSDAAFSTDLLRPAFRNIARFCQAGAIAFVFIDWRGAPQLLDAANGVFHEVKNLIIWGKTNAGMGTFYRSQHELIYAFKVSPGEHINNFGLGQGGRHRSNLWIYPGANVFRRGRDQDLEVHPTIKPKKMIADAIQDCSRRGGIVLDSFAGSGTTLVAAAMTGRRSYGVELDPHYCDVVIRRVQEASGYVARLENGMSFDAVARERSQSGRGR